MVHVVACRPAGRPRTPRLPIPRWRCALFDLHKQCGMGVYGMSLLEAIGTRRNCLLLIDGCFLEAISMMECLRTARPKVPKAPCRLGYKRPGMLPPNDAVPRKSRVAGQSFLFHSSAELSQTSTAALLPQPILVTWDGHEAYHSSTTARAVRRRTKCRLPVPPSPV
eukprot:354756-Chlamydomonas_euryale.AAC.3